MSKCLCGCGEEAKPGNKYIHGHYQKMKSKRKVIKETKTLEDTDSSYEKAKETIETSYNIIDELYKEINYNQYIKNKDLFNYIVNRDIVLLLRDILEELKR